MGFPERIIKIAFVLLSLSKINLVSSDEKTVDEFGKCECGVFEFNITEEIDPIIKQTPINVTCDQNGQKNCLGICSALAQAAKEQGPEILCSHLNSTEGIQVGVYGKICKEEMWTHTGISSPTPLCCEESRVKNCTEVGTEIPTTTLSTS